jgi:hypothetical protein
VSLSDVAREPGGAIRGKLGAGNAPISRN